MNDTPKTPFPKLAAPALRALAAAGLIALSHGYEKPVAPGRSAAKSLRDTCPKDVVASGPGATSFHGRGKQPGGASSRCFDHANLPCVFYKSSCAALNRSCDDGDPSCIFGEVSPVSTEEPPLATRTIPVTTTIAPVTTEAFSALSTSRCRADGRGRRSRRRFLSGRRSGPTHRRGLRPCWCAARTGCCRFSGFLTWRRTSQAPST